MSNIEGHHDNLDMQALNNAQKKEHIFKEVLMPAQKALYADYNEALKTLTPHQVAQLITNTYASQGNFLTYKDIKTGPTYTMLVQTALAMLGYDLPIDADYGSKTKAAVQDFEKKHGLSVDSGIAGPQVLQTLTKQLHQKGIDQLTHARLPSKESTGVVPKNVSQATYEKMTTNSREKMCFDVLRKLGYNAVVAAGIIGNLWVESYDRKNTKKRFHTSARGDGGKSFGLCQWNNNGGNSNTGRRTKLERFAKKSNSTADNYAVQLAFIQHELDSTHLSAKKSLEKVTTPVAAAKAFMVHYERPSDKSTLGERQTVAQRIYNTYGKDEIA